MRLARRQAEHDGSLLRKQAERTAEEQELFGSWKRFGRKQPKTTLERPRPGDSVIVRMRGFVIIRQSKQGGTALIRPMQYG